MTIRELQQRGAIFFEKITEGFRDYADIKFVLDEKKALAHFKNLKKEYGAENSFADFYYFRLDEDSREMVDELLTQEEQSYLKPVSYTHLLWNYAKGTWLSSGSPRGRNPDGMHFMSLRAKS